VNYNLNTVSGPDDIVGQFSLEEISNGAASGVTPYIGLFRVNGWPALAGDNPAPISPTPLVTESKGKGFRIIKISSSAGVVTFSL
jgi:hypothetical protein